MNRAGRRRTGRSGAPRGFTLLEALVALTLASVITAGVGMALRTGLDASQRIQERSDQHAEARAALSIMERDLRAAFLSAVNPQRTLFQAEPPPGVSPGEPFLSFSTLAFHDRRGVEPRSDAVRVEYALVTPPEGRDGPPQLERRERWLTGTGTGSTSIVCERLVGLQLRYDGGRDTDDRWSAAPGPEPDLSYRSDQQPAAAPATRRLPRAVEITLLLAPPDEHAGAPPRVYHTRVLLEADAAPPFEPEETPAPKPGQDANGQAPNSGPPGGANGQ